MPLPIVPLLAVAAIAALALGGSKDKPAAGAPTGPTAPPGHPDGPPTGFNPFDKNLTASQLVAIQTALTSETDPNKLDAFAASLLPDFPIASAALTARAMSLRVAAAANVPPPPPPVIPLPPQGVIIPAVIPATPFTPPIPIPVIPPFTPPPIQPIVFSDWPKQGTVTTHDTGPSGALLVRVAPAGDALEIGSNPHGAAITVTGPAINGFYPVAPTGFSSAAYITLGAGAPAVVPAVFNPVAGPSFPAPGSHARVATATDPLNLRASPPSGNVIGSSRKDSIVTITGPINQGFYPITNEDGQSGWSSAQYLASAPTTVSAGAVGLTAGARVQTTANTLGLRASPDARQPYVAKAQRGATFTIAGPAWGNYYPLRDDSGRVAWASAMYLAPASPSPVAAGFGADTGVGPSIPFAELHTRALELKTALATHGCRSYNEPLVKEFQRTAKAAGIYNGPIDGWYGTVTQASLSQIVGKPAPACFPEAKGGPVNPNEYWSPMGV